MDRDMRILQSATSHSKMWILPEVVSSDNDWEEELEEGATAFLFLHLAKERQLKYCVHKVNKEQEEFGTIATQRTCTKTVSVSIHIFE
jgi:hypothetical protein